MVPSFETKVSVLDRFLSVRYQSLFSGFVQSGISTVSAKAPSLAASEQQTSSTEGVWLHVVTLTSLNDDSDNSKNRLPGARDRMCKRNKKGGSTFPKCELKWRYFNQYKTFECLFYFCLSTFPLVSAKGLKRGCPSPE